MADALLAVQLHQAERAVSLHPGLTIPELADTLSADRVTLTDALHQLEQAGRVYRFVPVTCRITGQPRCPWFSGPDPMDSSAALPASLTLAYAQVMAGLPAPVDPTQCEMAL